MEWEEVVQRIDERYDIEEFIETLNLYNILETEYDNIDYSEVTVKELLKLRRVKIKVKKKIEELDIA